MAICQQFHDTVMAWSHPEVKLTQAQHTLILRIFLKFAEYMRATRNQVSWLNFLLFVQRWKQ